MSPIKVVATAFLLCFVSALASAMSRSVSAPPPPMAATFDSLPTFDGLRAFRWLERQVEFGARVPGTDAHARCLEMMVDQFRQTSDAVDVQAFTIANLELGSLPLANVIARFRPTEKRRLLLSAHWDSRPWADQDPNPEMRSHPVPGANDGASGAAILLQLATILHDSPPSIGVDIVLFDGEDLGTTGVLSTWCQGSRHFARLIPDSVSYLGAVNLDMVGGKNLRIKREIHSQENAGALLDLLFSTAAEAGLTSFVDERGTEIYDDHVPLQDARIDAVDLIDLDYAVDGQNCWHTTLDTPDRCSPESLGSVGTLLVHLIYRSSSQL